MAKEIILYNLADNVTDEQYKDFVIKEKGPLLIACRRPRNLNSVKITGAATGEIPFKYVGILHLKQFG